jgi:murein DD-endopeptidase MepM/ murein hydrolase activator NlpD
MRRPVTSYTKISSTHGAKNVSKFNKHLGIDYAGEEDRDVLAPVNGVITQSYLSASIGNTYEIKEDGNGRLHRLPHLKTRPLGVGARVSEGQVIAKSGGAKGQKYSGTNSSGPHVHWDIRKAGTAWDASFGNYYDPEALLAEQNKPKPAPAPSTGKRIYFTPIGQTATFYKNSGGTFPMKIKDASYNWAVLAEGDRWVEVTSASAGGRGKLYLIDKNGKTIPGRYVK